MKNTIINRLNEEKVLLSQTLPQSILLVEDDRAHAQLISRALKGLTVKVSHVIAVSDAMEHLKHNQTDLILTDLNLVSSTGFEWLKLLKESGNDLPVIVLTSSANLEDAVRSMREGAWDYLTKQFAANFSSHLEIVLARNWERAQQKQREREAQAERNAFWMASSLADDGLAILNTQGGILYRNAAFLGFLEDLGVDRDSNTSELVSIISKYDFQLSQDLFSQIHIGEDSIWRSELAFERGSDQHQKYYELRLSTVQDRGYLSDEVDLPTEVFKSGLRYHVLWVKDLTQIRVSEKLERDLLATTTHDLKGPLGAIITSTDLVIEEEPGKFVEDMVLRIASCARTCINLVDELLSAKRLQDGMMEIHPDWIDLLEPTNEVFLDFESVAKSKGITFNLLKGSLFVPAFVDALAVKRILANLIGNALKFTPRNGEVTIEIDKTKQGAVLKVGDNGAGISPEKQARLFEMFGRLPEHTKIEGTGLGLYITKKLVDMQGAKLELKSSAGAGSVFSVRFNNPPKK